MFHRRPHAHPSDLHLMSGAGPPLPARLLKKINLFLVLIPSLVLLGVIYLPFAKPLSLAALFAMAIVQVSAQYRALGRRKRWAFAVGGALLGIALLWMFSQAFSQFYLFIAGEDGKISGARLGEITNGASNFLNHSIDSVDRIVRRAGVEVPGQFRQQLASTTNNLLGQIAGMIASIFSSLPAGLFSFLIFWACLIYFLFSARSRFPAFAAKVERSWRDFPLIIAAAKEAAYSAVVANIVTGLVQAVLLTIGFLIAGISQWSLVFAATFFFSLVPLVGSLPIAVGGGIYAYTNFGGGSLTIVIIAAVITGIADNIVRPYLVSSAENSISAFWTFIGVIGAVAMFGFSGLFLGPFLICFFAAVVTKLGERILPAKQ